MTTTRLRMLSAGSVEPGLVTAIEAYTRSTGRAVALQWATTPDIRRRLAAGERYDVVLLTAEAASDMARAGHLRDEAPVPVGSVGVGIAVRSGTLPPDIGDAASVAAALLGAERVIFTRATSGQHVDAMLRREGLHERLQARILRFDTGPAMLDHLFASTEGVICLGAIGELRMFDGRGLHYVGPLPDPLQHQTVYVVARTPCADPGAALEFSRFLRGAEARDAFIAGGVEAPAR